MKRGIPYPTARARNARFLRCSPIARPAPVAQSGKRQRCIRLALAVAFVAGCGIALVWWLL